jgi:hypothetical protein
MAMEVVFRRIENGLDIIIQRANPIAVVFINNARYIQERFFIGLAVNFG